MKASDHCAEALTHMVNHSEGWFGRAIEQMTAAYTKTLKVEKALKALSQVQAFWGDRIPLKDPEVKEWFRLTREAISEGLV